MRLPTPSGQGVRMVRKKFEFSDAFAEAVKKHREARGLSRAALAEKSGLHQTYIGLLEKGQRSPNLDTVNAIAKALGVRVSKLIQDAETIATSKTS